MDLAAGFKVIECKIGSIAKLPGSVRLQLRLVGQANELSVVRHFSYSPPILSAVRRSSCLNACLDEHLAVFQCGPGRGNAVCPSSKTAAETTLLV
jgi:hypothetical protein